VNHDPKAALRIAYLAGRRGIRWPLAWARVMRLWNGPKAWEATSAAWNAGRQDAGLEAVRLV
jgi:hypothetical protein